ncbi:MAG: alkaline phosphatase, partial [Planctomycetota bacterium]
MTRSNISRRGFLTSGAAAGLLWSSRVAGGSPIPLIDTHQKEARNVIFLVADGMNTGTWSIADYYTQHQSQQRTEWVQLYQEEAVTRSLMETCSSNSHVTDSAAAASSWSTGQRINNGAINVSPDGSALVPIHELVKKSRRSTGLVTTTRVTHATPAAFAASVASRGKEDAIALQYLERGVDVILGGGSKHFDGAKRGDKIDLAGRYQAEGYEWMESREQLISRSGELPKRLLGTF